MNNSRTKNMLMNTGTGLIVKVVTLLSNFIMRTVFIRLLGIQYTGVSTLFTDILTVFSFAELGIGAAITYALYRPIAEQDDRQIAKLMNFYKKAYRIVGLFVFFGGVCLIPFLGVLVRDVPEVKESIALIYFLYILNTAFSYFLIYKSSLLIASQKKYVVSKIELACNVLKTIVQCTLLFATGQFLTFLFVEIIVTLLRNVIISLNVSKNYPNIRKYKDEKLSKEEIHKLMMDVGALAMYKISFVVLSSTDSIVISSMLGTALVGFLGNYKMIVNSVDSLVNQFFLSVTPSIGNLAVEKGADIQYAVFQKIYFLSFWMACFSSISFAVLMNPFVNIWLGKDYLLSMPVIIVLVMDFYVINMIRAVASFRTGNGLFIYGKYRPVLMAILNIALSIILAYYMGIFGVLLATVISRLATQAWYDSWLVYKRVFHHSVWDFYGKYLRYTLVTIGLGLLTYFMANLLVTGNNYVDFIYKAICCIILPNVGIILCFRKTKMFNECMSVVKRIIMRKA